MENKKFLGNNSVGWVNLLGNVSNENGENRIYRFKNISTTLFATEPLTYSVVIIFLIISK